MAYPSVCERVKGVFFGINRLLQDGSIAKLLTDLLKKDGFKWGKRPQQAFEILRSAMSKAPVLPLPDFSKPFIVETDQAVWVWVLCHRRKAIQWLLFPKHLDQEIAACHVSL